MSLWWWFCQCSEIVDDDNGWSDDDYNDADYDVVKLPLPYYHQGKEEGFDNDEGRENDDLVDGETPQSGNCEFVESVNGRHSGLIIWICATITRRRVEVKLKFCFNKIL